MKLKITILIVSTLLSTTCLANTWEERALLERYVHQLELLNNTLLRDAQLVSDPNARISMNYPALLHDTQEIVAQIKHHLNSPLEEYRSVIDAIERAQQERAGASE